MSGALEWFGPATRAWFAGAFPGPTRVQAEGWARIAAGEHTLLLAPTGSGKTLAAFLAAIDRLTRLPLDAPPGVRVLYVSPLKALIYDVERNLRAPLAGVALAGGALGAPLRPVSVSVRTGDTSARDRRLQARTPGDVLITTPESLFLILGSAARETLRTVETIIVDEVHALAGSKRGSHLALSLERLAALCGRDPQRVGLSATVRPAAEVARFLGGVGREVALVDTSEPPRLELSVTVPVADMERPPPPPPKGGPLLGAAGAPPKPGAGIWPALTAELLGQIRAHRSTIVFVNSRILCERLAQALNEEAGEELVRAHHGSLAHRQRTLVEEALKAGQLRGLVATSSLELGIDMGAVDLVLQVASPGAVSRGLQRVGRAGHGVGQVSQGRILPKYRGDLLECAVVARGMLDGALEPLRVPRRCLDVLAQQLVAIVASEPWQVDDLERLVRRADPYRDLPREALLSVLELLSGHYPSDELADLRPSISWDRAADRVEGRRHARMLAALNAGTIPDRGLYRVVLGEGGPRVGELDEEMVHEVRKGETFVLGASTWRITDITRDRVLVEPAPGEPGRLPFWRGDGPGRPLELGRAIGAFLRQVGGLEREAALAWIQREAPLDRLAAENLWAYLDEQRRVTGTLPSDRRITVERFRDELGDWRVCLLSPFGGRVHAPWALALEAALGQRTGVEVQALWSDDGVMLRLAGAEEPPPLADLLPAPDELEERVLDQLGRSPLFAAHFRECAGRALLLPRRHARARTPLWALRQRSEQLLAVASRHPRFPLVLEATRECLQDVFDLPALQDLLGAIQRRELHVDEVETASPSPFARSLAFAWVAAYIYETDAPLAERRAQALTLDRALLSELLGEAELRQLLDPQALAELEAELQGLTPRSCARDPDELHDLLRRLGDLRLDELTARCPDDPSGWLAALEEARRVFRVRVAGEERWVAGEDLARYRDALGVVPPPGAPAALLGPSERPLEALLLRFARARGPFLSEEPARRLGLMVAQVEPLLRALEAEGRLLRGALRPGGTRPEWCDPEVLRRLRGRTLARLRAEIAPVDAATLGRFLPRWHGVRRRGAAADPRPAEEALRQALLQLEGVAIPFSALEGQLLPARLTGYRPALLDALGASGEVVWIGAGALGPRDGRVVLAARERAALLLEPPAQAAPEGPLQAAILEQLERRGACFWLELRQALGEEEAALQEALWDLVWAGRVTNDTFQPIRALGGRGRASSRRARAGRLAGGRWSSVRQLLAGTPAPAQVARARAEALLLRHGVVTREAVSGEELPGGWSGVYPALRALEEAGRARRGWFVEGLGGAQFASPGAVEGLRGARAEVPPEPLLLGAVDPANPWGSALPWPEGAPGAPRPRRVAGAEVLLVDGAPVLFLERGGRSLLTFPALSEPERSEAGWAALLERAGGGRRSLRIERIDGVPARSSPWAERLEQAGFVPDYRGLLLVGGAGG